MKIVFIGMDSIFTENMGYQENFFADICIEKGCDTVYISGNEEFCQGTVVDTKAEDRILKNGLHLYRLPYMRLGPKVIYKKIRIFKGVYKILEKEEPDVIYCHNSQYSSVLDVAKYKRKHPDVHVYADTHVAASNSARNWISLHVLHRIYYKQWIIKLYPALDKYFYIDFISKEFAVDNYNISEDKMEFLPLGGIPLPDDQYYSERTKTRDLYNIGRDDIVLLHTGKLDIKKKTEDLLSAFSKVKSEKLKLFVVGSVSREIKEQLTELIDADERIKYLGWKTIDEMSALLCAADLYCQPGSPSATLQQAICERCAVMAYPYDLYKKIDMGNILWVNTKDEIYKVITDVESGTIQIDSLKNNARICAGRFLDYSKQVDHFLQYNED